MSLPASAKAILQAVGETMQSYVARALDDRVGELERRFQSRLQELDSRLSQAETRASALVYRGVWRADQSYSTGNFATDHGGVWHCNRPTQSRPGADDSWTLAVKRGAHGRDAQ